MDAGERRLQSIFGLQDDELTLLQSLAIMFLMLAIYFLVRI